MQKDLQTINAKDIVSSEPFNDMKMAAKPVVTVPFNDMANLLTLCPEPFNDIL